MPVAASAVLVAVAAPVVLMVVVVPAVLVVAARALFVRVALVSDPAVHMGWLMPVGGVAVVPGAVAASARISTSGRLPVRRLGEAAVQLLELLHVEPHHVVHHDILLQIIGR